MCVHTVDGYDLEITVLTVKFPMDAFYVMLQRTLIYKKFQKVFWKCFPDFFLSVGVFNRKVFSGKFFFQNVFSGKFFLESFSGKLFFRKVVSGKFLRKKILKLFFNAN